MLNRIPLTIVAVSSMLLFAGCARPAASSSTEASATSPAMPASTATPNQSSEDASTSASATPSPEPAYTDLAGVFGAATIEQLHQLGVFDADAPATTFSPNKPILRRTFVRWMFEANNKIVKDDSKLIHAATASDASSFHDLAATDRDFDAIQGLQKSGISVGFPDGTFRPDVPITREQAVSEADLLSCDYRGAFTGDSLDVGYSYLPSWKDKRSVSKTYVPVLAACAQDTEDIVGRAYGKTLTFAPSKVVTRAEAALMLSTIDGRSVAQDMQSPTP